MSFQLTTKQFAAYSVAAALIAASQGGFAHTGVKETVDVNVGGVPSGSSSNNAFVITHGCAGAEGDTPIPVIGQSAVFPFGDDAVWVKLSDGSPTTADAVIGKALDLDPGGVYDAGVFKTVTEENDPTAVNAHGSPIVRAINYLGGNIPPNLAAYAQFRVSVPAIVDKCVSKLRIRVAVANWCEKDQNQKSDVDNNRADWWFTGETGSTRFRDKDLLQPTFWTTMTVNNLMFDAASCGAGYEVAVMPSGASIDQYLPHPAYVLRPGPF
jgi:hypothetical protein